MSILGNRVLRREDPKLLTEGGSYVDDLPLPGAAHVTYVRSTVAHARIASVDTGAAESAPGVIAVFTGADVDLEPVAATMPMLNQSMLRPWLARDVVRFVGEPVAAIVTEERYQGPDAAEQVAVEYEPLPVIVDPEAAEQNEVLLFPDAGTNVALELAFGHTDDLFADCEVVVRQRVVNQRVAPCPLEPRAGAAAWGDDGRLTYWASTQAPHGRRDELARYLGVAPEQVRVIAPDVGGGFGAKAVLYLDELLLAWIARRLGRPVRWAETRSENMTSMSHGRGQVQQIEIGGGRDGVVHAYRLTVLQDAGAYPGTGAFLPFLTRMMASGVYAIPKVEYNSRSVVTNTTSIDAYRGAGRPEATAAIERAMDLFAAEIGADPAEVRRKNLVSKDAFPFTTPTGATYDSGDYERALDLLLDAAHYQDLRAEQARRRTAGDTRQLGIGLSIYVEITNPVPGGEFGGVEVTPAGKAIVRAGTFSHGQGHATAFAMIVSDRLGIPLEDIEVVQGDTDAVPSGQGTMGSRSLQTAGSAVNQAAAEVLERARQLAADLLEASPDDVVLDPGEGRFHVAGTPGIAKTWAELATAAQQQSASTGTERSGLAVDVDFMPQGPTFPFGAHLAVVEVDTETGKVELTRMVTVDDCGRVLNPLLVEGQRHGGIAQGVAQALTEEYRYDEEGNPVTANLADYTFISAAELPSFELVPMETPTPLNELGAKGIGESGTIGSTPAVQNAVVDALSHLGVRHLDMPTTPERVWLALHPR